MNISTALATDTDRIAIEKIREAAASAKLDIGSKILRTSSRFCLGVEHGDYNGTELFGIGTDRFIWLGYKPNNTSRIKIFSVNFPTDGIVEFDCGNAPAANTAADSWARFAYGSEYILRQKGYKIGKGFDAVLYGNIPGGGMSRSASLTLNLILTMFDVNAIGENDGLKIVDLAQAVENVYIGSPCGQLDQIMILFAKEAMGTHYSPQKRTITHIPLGKGAVDFTIVSLDTGTLRPGLEKSTYKMRRQECEELVRILQAAGFKIASFAQVDDKMYKNIRSRFAAQYPALVKRLTYIYESQKRFYQMLTAWKSGDIKKIGEIFRLDGIGLRDDYAISGPELETMCDIARTVPGILGERMLGGGDKGSAGAIILTEAFADLKKAVERAYPLSHPQYKDKYAVHALKSVAGVQRIEMP